MSKRSQQHIVIHIIASKATVLIYFFSGSCFYLQEHWAGAPVRPTRFARRSPQSFCDACVPLWPSAFSEGLLPGETASGSSLPCWAPEIWDTATSPVLASLNAKQHGVGLGLALSEVGLPGERGQRNTISQLTKQECRGGWKARGRVCVRIQISLHLNCLIIPPCQQGRGKCG